MDLDVTKTLQEFLEAHSVKTETQGQALKAGRMFLSAKVFKKSSNVSNLLQLDVNVNSPIIPGRTLVESFAGWGDDEQEAINSAWGKFSSSSLHVLLDVFAGQRNDEQTEWERWGNDDKAWQVCMGPLFILGFGDQQPPSLICGDLIDRLRDELLPGTTRECHWLRFYYMRSDGSRVGSECLLDNKTWPAGQTLVDEWNWPDGSYSARLFLIMLPELDPTMLESKPGT